MEGQAPLSRRRTRPSSPPSDRTTPRLGAARSGQPGLTRQPAASCPITHVVVPPYRNFVTATTYSAFIPSPTCPAAGQGPARRAGCAARPPQEAGSRPTRRRRRPAPAFAPNDSPSTWGHFKPRAAMYAARQSAKSASRNPSGGSEERPQPSISHATTVNSSESASSWRRRDRLSKPKPPCNSTSGSPSPARS